MDFGEIINDINEKIISKNKNIIIYFIKTKIN
jgi:hypothetical protein